MRILTIVLLIVAVISFGLAALNIPVARVNLVGLGLLAWVLTVLISVLT